MLLSLRALYNYNNKIKSIKYKNNFEFRTLLNIIPLNWIQFMEFLKQKKKNYKLLKKKSSTFLKRQIAAWIKSPLYIYLNFTFLKRKFNLYFTIILKRYQFHRFLIMSLVWIEPTLITKFMCAGLTKIHFLGHRLMMKKAITLLVFLIKKYKFTLGLFFTVSGKVSVCGNARTRTMGIKYGLWSKSKSWLRGTREFDIIYTFTGCLGLYLFYSF